MDRRFGRNDIIFLAALAAAIAGFLFWFYSGSRKGGEVVVTVDGVETGRYPLSEERQIEIRNAEGKITNVLVIRDGYADMTEADCSDQLCVYQSRISRENENLVCLPNRVVVTVVGGETSDVDAVAN